MKSTLRSIFAATLALLCLTTSIQASTVNWGNITAAELSNLPLSDFQEISALEVSVIPPEAFDGFDATRINAIPYLAIIGISDEQFSHLTTSCAGFTAVQVSRLRVSMTAECLSNLSTTDGELSGCAGLQPSLVAKMDPQAFSGFTSECINVSRRDVMMEINATQLAALNPTACTGFRSGQVFSLPANAAPGLTKDCLANFSPGDKGACSGIAADFIRNVPATTFQGFTAGCIRGLLSFTFTNISTEQIQNIPAPSFAGFDSSVLHWMPHETFMAVSVEQLSYLSQMGFVSLLPDMLAAIINKYQLAIVNRWTIDQVALYGELLTMSFLDKVPSQVPLMTSWPDLSQRVSEITWLQLALVKTDPLPVLDSNVLSQLAPHTFAGLHSDLVHLIQPSDFVYFTPNVTKFITNFTTAAFSAEQFTHFPADSIRVLPFKALAALTPSVISAMTPAQLAVVTTEQINYLTCDQIYAFSTTQAQQMSKVTQNRYYYAMVYCKTYHPLTSPSTSPTAVPSIDAPESLTPSQGIINTPSNSTTPNELSPLAVAIIVMSGVTGLTIMSGVVLYIIMKRRSESGLYQHLLSSEAQTPLVNKV